jgi:hypothetical protein
MKIAITLSEGASMHDAIIDCARSIAEGYGAGSLTTEEDGEIEAWLGFWTSIPNDTEEYDLVIDIPEDMKDDDYLVAGLVRRKAKEYQS